MFIDLKPFEHPAPVESKTEGIYTLSNPVLPSLRYVVLIPGFEPETSTWQADVLPLLLHQYDDAYAPRLART